MTQLTISVPPALMEWIDERVASGLYADATDYIRHLIRRDKERVSEDTAWLRGMIDEGLASGVLDEEPEDVLHAIMSKYPANRG